MWPFVLTFIAELLGFLALQSYFLQKWVQSWIIFVGLSAELGNECSADSRTTSKQGYAFALRVLIAWLCSSGLGVELGYVLKDWVYSLVMFCKARCETTLHFRGWCIELGCVLQGWVKSLDIFYMKMVCLTIVEVFRTGCGVRLYLTESSLYTESITPYFARVLKRFFNM